MNEFCSIFNRKIRAWLSGQIVVENNFVVVEKDYQNIVSSTLSDIALRYVPLTRGKISKKMINTFSNLLFFQDSDWEPLDINSQY